MRCPAIVTAAIMALGTIGLSGCASGPQTVVDYDASAGFSDYQSFAWAGEEPVNTDGVNRTVSALTKRQIADAVAGELGRKGYAFVEDTEAADFLVMVTLGRRDQIEIDSFAETQYAYVPRSSRATGYAPGVYGYGYKTTGQTVEAYTEGSISIDIFDNDVGRPVWFGHVSDEVTPLINREQAKAMILEAVPTVLDQFPPDGQ